MQQQVITPSRPQASSRRAKGFASILFLTLLAATPLAAASPLFTEAAGSPFAAGTAPRGVATGDFNGDGKADIAAANSTSNDVTVLLGDGTGGFVAAPGSPFAVGTLPFAIVVRDFNHDGKLDLATANSNSNDVTILLGNGAGGFSPAPGSPYTVGTRPQFLASADFNGDTFPDLAVTNNGSDTVSILLGNGSGGFTAAPGSPVATGSSPKGVVAVDFDTDGKIDLAIAENSGGHITLLLGNGAGGFASIGFPIFGTTLGAAAVSSFVGMATGDFYSHGKPDLVIANASTNSMQLLKNNSGNLSYNAQFPAFFAPLNLVSGDFDQDGKADVGVVCSTTNQIFMLLGNGAGNFNVATGPSFPTGTNPYAAAAADFNNDGNLDIVVTNSGSNNLTVLLTSGPPLPPVVPPTPGVLTPQTISFAIPDHLGSDQPFALQATASSGLPVSFQVAGGPATVNGNLLTLTGLGTVTVLASQDGNALFSPASTLQSFNVTLGNASVSSVVNGASWLPGPLAPNMYAAIFGRNFSSGSALGDASFSRSLKGTSVTLVDSAKKQFSVNVWFMSFSQINFVVPDSVAPGAATIVVSNSVGQSSAFSVTIGSVAPGLFTADSTGSGPAAATAVVVAPDGTQSYVSAATCIPVACSLQTIPLATGNQVFLTLFGTGIRGRSSLAGVTLSIGGLSVPVSFAGAQGTFPALDQLIALIPASLAGAGTVDLKLAIDGVAANTVKLKLQ